MTRPQAWSIHLTNLLVGATGVALGVMAYALEPADEFAIVNHPWQPTMRHAHILLAPALVFAVGWIWQAHVWPRLRSGYRSHRRTGWVLVVSLAPMVLSGYALQVAEQEGWRTVWIWTHGVTSCAWLLFALVHPWLPRRQRNHE